MNTILRAFAEIIQAWRQGSLGIRSAISLGVVALAIAGLIRLFAPFLHIDLAFADSLYQAALFAGGASLFSVYAWRSLQKQSDTESKVKAAEKRFEENPDQPTVAWDLARIKLERYLDHNLSQVRSIYWLTVLVMGLGFVLIGYGVFKVYGAPEQFKPSIVAASSGILVNFIGASLLVIYRSTMAQAKDYVSVLERINAVGMAIQILESMDSADAALKNQTTAEIAKKMLVMYSKDNER